VQHHPLPNAHVQAWGHSMAVGPFAEVLASGDDKPGIVYADMDLAQVRPAVWLAIGCVG